MSGLRNLACGAALALIAVFAIAPHAGYTISSTPVMVVNPVTVGNPDDPAAFAKAQGIQHPFHITARCPEGDSQACVLTDAVDFSTLFPNQRIIIEYYSISCTFVTGLSLRTVEFIDSNNFIHYSAPILDHAGASVNFVSAVTIAQPARIYLDPGTKLDLSATAFGTPTSITNLVGLSCDYVFSGQAIAP